MPHAKDAKDAKKKRGMEDRNWPKRKIERAILYLLFSIFHHLAFSFASFA
jgi:hypothetical protein